MKVAYIVNAGKGIESFIYREIDQMVQRGIQISLYATKYKKGDIFSPKNEWDLSKLSYLAIIFQCIWFLIQKPVLFFKLLLDSKKNNGLIELLISVYFASEMKKRKVEHIHCHFGDRKYFIAYYCKRILNIPLSLTVHAHELFANPNEIFFRHSLHYADKVIAISEKNKNILIDDYKLDPKKVVVIRLSIDLENFKKIEKIKVLTVARYTERKGFHELFQAIKLINRDDVEFITVGFGDLDLDQMAKDQNVEDKVIIFDKMNPAQLSYFYNNCDIFCLPSKTTEIEGAEGIPVVLMEAMASEMLIVTTPNGSIPELVDEILVDEADPHALAKGLLHAIDKLGSDKFQGPSNRKKVINDYSVANVDKLKEYLYD